jgi:hypothetical protein
MALKILRSPLAGVAGGAHEAYSLVTSQAVLASASLLGTVQNYSPVFAGLGGGMAQLAKHSESVHSPITDLNKMLSMVHRLMAAFDRHDDSRKHENAPARRVDIDIIIQSIIQTAPWRKLTVLFDPHRSDERFRELLTELSDNKLPADAALELLERAEERILSELAAKQRYLMLVSVEDQNIQAHESILASQEMLALYKHFSQALY